MTKGSVQNQTCIPNVKETTRIVRFAVIGTLNALITAFVVWLMMHVLGFHYTVSNITAYVVAQTHNFLWCKYWIFPLTKGNKNSTCRQVLLFLVAFLLAYGAQFLFLIILVERLGSNEYLAQFLGLFIYGSVNFLMNRRVTFR